MKLSPARRAKIERFVARVLRRERWQLASAVVYLSRAKLGGGEPALAARIVLWSPTLGQMAVTEVDTGVRRTMSRVMLRIRNVIRRRLQKLQTQRRRLGRNRVRRFFGTLAARGSHALPTEGLQP